ncbi:unnamed protein product [Caenorhabditis bovis]|uniref:Lipase_GDSL domain-containing protein n=1 Tax=Caenorhabditis bovis TaxID=2654633 RepID=A0A8S1F5G6_9PELO|nr:unnamed protein product [Caenorhabditis bovis]
MILRRLFFYILLVFSRTTFCEDYENYDYDWLTDKPFATTPTTKKPPEDDDIIVDRLDDREVVNNEIKGGFSNKKSFTCPKVKNFLHTGSTVSRITPEDISIVAAMGDSLASGRGLWPFTDVEFRGAAFPIGGDANMDGLVTFPNILSQFTSRLDGISHGMGSRDQLPDYQLNVAEFGAETEDLPYQARELVRRINRHIKKEIKHRWALIFIATGSEEFCEKCEPPNRASLRKSLGILRKGAPRSLVVLLGPIHVASTYSQNINIMRPRCKCLEKMSGKEYRKLFSVWRSAFIGVEEEFNRMNQTTFGVLAIPSLAIHSRKPQSLLVPGKPLLNRKGHSYAAKWLWNRLIAGPQYNISNIALSEDSYYCPSAGCPYFRTVQNFKNCQLITLEEWEQMIATTLPPKLGVEARKETIRRNLAGVIAIIFALSCVSVLGFGTYFYCHGKRATKGRFDYGKQEDEVEDAKAAEIVEE